MRRKANPETDFEILTTYCFAKFSLQTYKIRQIYPRESIIILLINKELSVFKGRLNTLNNSFTNTNIQFVLHGTDFIDSDYYYNNLTDKENQLFTVNAHENAIDIYVLGTSTTWIGSGLANGIPSTALIIHGKHYVSSG